MGAMPGDGVATRAPTAKPPLCAPALVVFFMWSVMEAVGTAAAGKFQPRVEGLAFLHHTGNA